MNKSMDYYNNLSLSNAVYNLQDKIIEKPIVIEEKSEISSDEFIKRFDSDFGKIEWDTLSGKVNLIDQGIVFDEAEIKVMGNGKLNSLEITMKKSFKGRFAKLTARDFKLLEEFENDTVAI